jgi:hypothetical protein
MTDEVTHSQTKAAWLSAYGTVASAVIAFAALGLSASAIWRTERNAPRYAVVRRDGSVESRLNFEDYGLFVQLEKRSWHSPGDKPVYVLRFARDPDYFEVTTHVAAVPQVMRTARHQYEVFFVGAGYGSPIVECDFKVQAY